MPPWTWFTTQATLSICLKMPQMVSFGIVHSDIPSASNNSPIPWAIFQFGDPRIPPHPHSLHDHTAKQKIDVQVSSTLQISLS